jgi:hypothetical protein
MTSAVPYDGMVNKPSEDGKSSQVNFSELSISGGIANLYNALKLAEQMSSQK